MSAESVCESDQVIEPEGLLIVESSGPLPKPHVEHEAQHGRLRLLPTHLGWNWFAFGGVELPVTKLKPFDYQVLGELLKVF